MPIFTVDIFSIQISPTWYGLMYAFWFSICYFWMYKKSNLSQNLLDTLLMYVFFGVIMGGRLGYVILYDFSYYIHNLEKIFFIWQGGMSFHGGLLWVIFSIFLFSRIYKIQFFELTDTLALIIPIALWLGRVGNYINGELLWYFPYSGPLAIEKSGVSYFPSTLLEMLLEGIGLFLVMYALSRKKRNLGFLSGAFLFFYGIIRIFIEFFRLPDAHIGYLFSSSWITLGMLYSIPMIVVGLFLMRFAHR